MSVTMSIKMSPKQAGALYQRAMRLENDLKTAISERDQFKALSKERGDFILNGEEMGYISTPEDETDIAYFIFHRCKLTDEYAIKSMNRKHQESDEKEQS